MIFVGSTLGAYIPTLWGASWLSPASLFGSTIGGIAAIYLVYKTT